MAHIDCSLYSESLLKNVHVIVYLPSVSADDMLEERKTDYLEPGKRFPYMILLHGMYGDCLDWPLKSGIEEYAQEKGIAVIMPSAENSFYLDMKHGENYLRYVGEELPQFMEKMFPLSEKRDDRTVAGLSMGGYGAFRIGLEYPERFGRIASLSGALIPHLFLNADAAHIRHLPVSYRRAITDDPAQMAGTDDDLLFLAEKIKGKSETLLPKMYMTVGTEDFILPLNEKFYAEMSRLGYGITYEKYPGEHNWAFWDAHIQDVLAWIG